MTAFNARSGQPRRESQWFDSTRRRESAEETAELNRVFSELPQPVQKSESPTGDPIASLTSDVDSLRAELRRLATRLLEVAKITSQLSRYEAGSRPSERSEVAKMVGALVEAEEERAAIEKWNAGKRVAFDVFHKGAPLTIERFNAMNREDRERIRSALAAAYVKRQEELARDPFASFPFPQNIPI